MEPTLAILSASQKSDLQAAFDTALARNQAEEGVWRDAYDLLYGFITTQNVMGIDVARSDVPVDPNTWLWLKGARFVNSGEGAFARLIRDYTAAQYEQRYGAPLPESQINEASNEIAKNFLGQWLGLNPTLGATQPDLLHAGVYDAGAAAARLFALMPDGTPTGDGENVAGWAGTVLFPNRLPMNWLAQIGSSRRPMPISSECRSEIPEPGYND